MKKIIGLLLIIYIVFLILTNVNAYEENKIEDLMYKYNIITLGQNEPLSVSWYSNEYPKGTLTKVAHIVGPILVEGNLGTSDYPAIEHSQHTNGISSYIQNLILAQGHAGGSTTNDNTKLYIGISNTLERYCEIYNWGCNEDNMNQYRVNGKEYYTRYETIKDTEDSKYINFANLYNDIVNEQAKLAKGETKEGVNDLYLESGGVYTIENINNVNNIHITDYNEDDITLININDTMIDNFPKVLIEDNQVSTNDYMRDNNESYYGNIVFSLPNARNIHFPSSSLIGHFVAPKADIFMDNMNFAGSFIVNSFTGSGSTEAHMYPYTLSSLPKEETSNSNSNKKEVKGDTEDNPETYDSIITILITILVSTIMIILSIYILFKYKKRNE